MIAATKSRLAPRLIYFSPYSSGGLADYTHEQAGALKDLGMDVCCLTTPDAARNKPNARYDRCPVLMTEPNRSTCPSRLKRRFPTTTLVPVHNDGIVRGFNLRNDFPATSEIALPLRIPAMSPALRTIVDARPFSFAEFRRNRPAGMQELLHSATVAIAGEVPLERLVHAVPAFPTISEVWLHLSDRYGL